MEPFLGQIQPFGFGFAPHGWTFCDGRLMTISQNPSLFSLFRTTFGGDGRTTFGLPDLRGRDMVHVGSRPGFTIIHGGGKGGTQCTTLNSSNMATHSHTGNIVAEGGVPASSNPNSNMLGASFIYAKVSATPGTSMSLSSVNINKTGSHGEFSNQSPFLGIYIGVALIGIYPSRT